jgi:hypothetical protein
VIEEIEEQVICHDCVGDRFLKKEIKAEGTTKKCSYCGKKRKSIQIPSFAEAIRSAIEEHFELTPSEPSALEYALLNDGESDYSWERSGEEVIYLIQDIAEIDSKIANDVQYYLSFNYGGDPKDFEENPFDDAYYEEKSPDDYHFKESWNFFCKEIKYSARYFCQSAKVVLDTLFGEVENLKTYNGQTSIIVAGPNKEISEIFRARVALTHNSLDQILKSPIQELGAPPPISAKNGRMNAAGISVFYGASDIDTCIAEVRPPIGCHVVIGKFDIIRNINLLDLDILSNVYAKGSYFDPDFGSRKSHAAFLQHLVNELTKPVLPGEETFEYLPTQVVAEYLTQHIEPKINGIIFSSSQVSENGQNIILFKNSCYVEPRDLPRDTIVSVDYVWRSDGDYDSITIFEELPDSPPKENKRNRRIVHRYNHDEFSNPPPVKTLHLDVENGIDVRVVQGVNYQVHKRYVSRYTRNKSITEEKEF